MIGSHPSHSGTGVYGPGTFINKVVLPVPVNARRVFELLASNTPEITKDQKAWNTVTFTGGSTPMIPSPIKAPVIAAAFHAMCGLIANELLEIRDDKPLRNSAVRVDTDHTSLWLGSIFTTHINGSDISVVAKSNKLASIFNRGFK
ncbi:hypothetical protein J3459_018265 [Metarhizium acridum]|uniref:uncharacterized protein n=1 Tax=Metarhizium acridum TaxID=92637 RepID=UPI001C6C4B76|nr:hypothetical protein J3459_018265 [Metarhizium acridum]KAG8410214.1 hypothetical protein J3458_018250 [Metarhizium acridum]